MSREVLKVSGVGKAYPSYGSNLTRFARWVGLPMKPRSEFWAVRGISFSLEAGEAIGIVGQNGAGKSTLLKLITGTVRPTEGSIAVRGRTSAILELGLGFNPDFTGRENVRHSGGLIGLASGEIERLMPEIEAFAEIGAFFDQPLRVFSSGMQARLAFALATAVRPEMLIIDEVLAVGDLGFQRRCFRRLEEFRESGTSIIFVSHDTDSIKRFCDRALWLHKGEVRFLGRPKEVCEQFERELLGGDKLAQSSPGAEPKQVQSTHDPSMAVSLAELSYGDGAGSIVDFAIRNSRGDQVNIIPTTEGFSIEYSVLFNRDCNNVWFGMTIKTIDGVVVYAFHTSDIGGRQDFKAGSKVQVAFRLDNALAPGAYAVNCGANHDTLDGREVLHRRIDVGLLRVLQSDDKIRSSGLANLRASPIIKPIRVIA